MNIEALATRYYTSLKTTCADLRTISAERRTSCQKVILLLQVITFPIVVIPLELCRLAARVTKYCCNKRKESVVKVATPILGSSTPNNAPNALSSYEPVNLDQFVISPGVEELNKICHYWPTVEALKPRNCPFKIDEDPGIRKAEIAIIAESIFLSGAEALVCPSHANLKPGFPNSLDRQFHGNAGPDYHAQLEALRKFFSNQCPPGIALVTSSGNLSRKGCRFIILVPAPHPEPLSEERRDRDHLYSVYYNALTAASALNLRSIAFPPISTGTNGFPPQDAARIAIRAIADFKKDHLGSSINRISIHDREPIWYQDYIKSATAPGGPPLSST